MCLILFVRLLIVSPGTSWNMWKMVTVMLKEKEIQQVILHTLDELRQTIETSERENYSKEELLQLLKQVANVMTQ